MFKSLCFILALLGPCISLAQLDTDNCTVTSPPQAPAAADKRPDAGANTMLLSRVVCEVEKALDAYQQSPEVQDKQLLPKLATADFDFKTVVDTKGGFRVAFLIFQFGSTVDKVSVNDVDFQYVPKSSLPGLRPQRTKSLQQELIDTIKSAAAAVAEQSNKPSSAKDPLVFKQLSVTISYGVTWDVNGGINAPLSLVTVGANVDRSKSTVQQVKLFFVAPKVREEKKGGS